MRDQKLRLLLILHLPPPIHGASTVGNYIKNSKIINKAFDTTYINLATNNNLKDSGKWNLGKILPTYNLLKELISHLKKSNYDGCYITLTASGLGFYKDLLVIFLLKFYKCKVIYHFHNKGVSKASNNKINKILYKWVFEDSKVILLSPYLYSDISAYVPEEDVYYCANGIPSLKDFHNELKTAGPVKLLFLSNMIKSKGVYVLLEALQKLKEKKLVFECHFVGGWLDIKEEEFKKRIFQLGLENYVCVHGPKYGDEKVKFLQTCDIFIFPTFYNYECFPLVLLEAMKYGLPIISTPEGGIKDIVKNGETGYIVSQKSIEELTDNIEILIKNPLLAREMGENGKILFNENFTLDKFEKNFVRVIQEANTRKVTAAYAVHTEEN